MRDLNEIQCFVKAAELKSFTAAAKALDMPKSSVSRKVANLEKRLGITLMVRTTRALNLTDAGRAFYHTALGALHEIEAAEKALDTSRQSVEGLLRITAPVEFAVGPFPKLVTAFLKAYPRVQIDLVLTERVVDLIAEGIDLAFRMGHLEDSSLRAKKLKPLHGMVVASPAYLLTRGKPQHLSEIEAQEWVRFNPGGTVVKWTLSSPEGQRTITPAGRFSANHQLALKQAVLDGLGFGVMAHFMIEEELERQMLQIVCPAWEMKMLPAHIVYPAQKFLSPKLRHFIDFVSQHL